MRELSNLLRGNLNSVLTYSLLQAGLLATLCGMCKV